MVASTAPPSTLSHPIQQLGVMAIGGRGGELGQRTGGTAAAQLPCHRLRRGVVSCCRAPTRPGRAQSDDGGRWRAQGRRMCAKAHRGRAAVAALGAAAPGGPARARLPWVRRRQGVCPADTRGPQEIEVRIYFPAGVDMQSWTSIFWSWICKWDLKASI
jgi:hypothetical protein